MGNTFNVWLINQFGEIKKDYIGEIKDINQNGKQKIYIVDVYKKIPLFNLKGEKVLTAVITPDDPVLLYKKKHVIIIREDRTLTISKSINISQTQLSNSIDTIISTSASLLSLKFLRYFFMTVILIIINIIITIMLGAVGVIH